MYVREKQRQIGEKRTKTVLLIKTGSVFQLYYCSNMRITIGEKQSYVVHMVIILTFLSSIKFHFLQPFFLSVCFFLHSFFLFFALKLSQFNTIINKFSEKCNRNNFKPFESKHIIKCDFFFEMFSSFFCVWLLLFY